MEDQGGGQCVPLAQTFTVEGDMLHNGSDPGCFLTKVELYFRTRHPIHGVEVSIHNTSKANFVPDYSMTLGKKALTPDQVNVAGNEDGPVNATIF